MRVYVAGPINGYPDGNRPAFDKVAGELRTAGHEPVNPHDIGPLDHPDNQHRGDPVDHSAHRYGCYMIPDLEALMRCDGFTLLPGWVSSRGARVEHDVAVICGLDYVPVPGSVPSSRV